MSGPQHQLRLDKAAKDRGMNDQLADVVQRIVTAFRPEYIILFGSYAYGWPSIDSDVDLLIVMESNQRPAVRAASISKVLQPRPFPMDILVRTPDEIRYRLEIGDYFFQEILSKGRVLYERSVPGRVGSEG
jgi:predicted nucleotidyltransferase